MSTIDITSQRNQGAAAGAADLQIEEVHLDAVVAFELLAGNVATIEGFTRHDEEALLVLPGLAL